VTTCVIPRKIDSQRIRPRSRRTIKSVTVSIPRKRGKQFVLRIYTHTHTHTYNESLFCKIFLYTRFCVENRRIAIRAKNGIICRRCLKTHIPHLSSFGHSDHIKLQIFLQFVFISFLCVVRAVIPHYEEITSRVEEKAIEILRQIV